MWGLDVRFTSPSDIPDPTVIIHHKLKITQTSHVGTQTVNERDRRLVPLPFIDFNSLTLDEVDVFNSTWCISDRVEISNSKLNPTGIPVLGYKAKTQTRS